MREGAYADINVIDVERLGMELPEYKHDFPGDAGRYVQKGRGYDQMIVNGSCSWKAANTPGRLAGMTLRS